MKEVVKEYAGAILAVIVGILLFGVIFKELQIDGNQGITDVFASQAQMETNDYFMYDDSRQTQIVMQRKLPVISVKNTVIAVGETWRADELFEATDADGKYAKISFLQVTDDMGNVLNITDDAVTFERQGRYKMVVRAVDTSCCVMQNVFTIPVRNRR